MTSEKFPQAVAHMDSELLPSVLQGRFKRLDTQNTNRPIEVFMHWRKNVELELDPPYQRGQVWGLKRKRALILSICLGVPIPAIVLNNRIRVYSHSFTEDEWKKIAVIDGKQRIQAIFDFVDGRFTVPGSWFGHPPAMVEFAELPHEDQLKFGNHPMACAEGVMGSLEEEKVVFDLINFSGMPQGAIDDDLLSPYPTEFVQGDNAQVTMDLKNTFQLRLVRNSDGNLKRVAIRKVPRQRKVAKQALSEWISRRYPGVEQFWVASWPSDWMIQIKL